MTQQKLKEHQSLFYFDEGTVHSFLQMDLQTQDYVYVKVKETPKHSGLKSRSQHFILVQLLLFWQSRAVA